MTETPEQHRFPTPGRRASWRLAVGLLLASGALLLASTSAQAVVVTSTSATVQWTPAAGPAVGYRIERSLNGSAFQALANTASTQVTLSGQPGDVVHIRVAAYNAIGQTGPWSPVSSPIEFASAPPAGGGTGGSGGGNTGSTPPPTGGTAVFSDFDGDGRSDVVIPRRGYGEATVLHMAGHTILSTAQARAPSAGYDYIGHGDLDGDRLEDLLWRNPATGELAIGLRGGAGSAQVVTMLPSDFSFRGAVDADGDRRDDLYFRDTTDGALYVWLMDGPTIRGAVLLATLPMAYSMVAADDFDGDGTPDLLWRDTTTGETYLWTVQNLSVTQMAPHAAIPGSYSILVRDMNGDGRADVIWRSASSGQLFLWEMNGWQILDRGPADSVNAAYGIFDLGDYDGDGMTDIIWIGPSGNLYSWLMQGRFAASRSPIAVNGN